MNADKQHKLNYHLPNSNPDPDKGKKATRNFAIFYTVCFVLSSFAVSQMGMGRSDGEINLLYILFLLLPIYVLHAPIGVIWIVFVVKRRLTLPQAISMTTLTILTVFIPILILWLKSRYAR